MKKELDLLNIDNDYMFSPVTAYLFSILEKYKTIDTNINLWLASNFINLYIDINLIDPEFPDKPIIYEEFFRQNIWYSCPFIECNNLDVSIINKYWAGHFDELCKSIINLDYYIYATINKKLLPNYNSKDNFVHKLLIYGYNNEKKIMNIADYFQKRLFSFEECTMKELNDAFDGLFKISDYKRHANINFLKYKENKNYCFRVDEIKNKLIDYRDSVNMIDKFNYVLFAYEYRNTGNLYYGVSYYDALCEMLILERQLSTKSIQILVMHKRLMCDRLEILYKNQIILNKKLIKKATDLLHKTILLRNLVLKLNVKNGEERISSKDEKMKLTKRILELKEEDYIFVSSLIEEL